MVVFKMRDSVPSPRYSPVCNVLRQWKTSLIPTHRVYRLYDMYERQRKNNFYYCRYCGCPACVCVPSLFVIFCHHVYLDPDVCVHRCTEISYIIILL